MRLRLGIDVDEVVADLHGPWIRWINATFGTSFDPNGGFPHWDFWQLPEYAHIGKQAYGFLTANIYRDDTVLPIPGVRAAIDRLRDRVDIAFVTSCNGVGAEATKLEWLRHHGLFKYSRADGYIPGHDKSNAPVHVLVDDGAHNVRNFKNGIPVLVTRPHNVSEKWDGLRINHLSELIPHFN